MSQLHLPPLLLLLLLLLGLSAQREQLADAAPAAAKDIFATHKLSYVAPDVSPGPHVAVFLHGAVGIFRKKRFPNETWGYGGEIIAELLNTSVASGLLAHAQTRGVYVTALGAPSDVEKVRSNLRAVQSQLKLQKGLKSMSSAPTLAVVVSGADLYVAEFPSLLAIWRYAQKAHDDALILYMHSKGMRNNGVRAADWRRYMTYFVAERFEICHEALLRKGYDTCGVLKNAEEYMGNFWWAKASFLKTRPDVATWKRWNMANRMSAEDWLLWGLTEEEQAKHFCIHSIDHNMYDVPTPRGMYELPPGQPFVIKEKQSSCQIQVKSGQLGG